MLARLWIQDEYNKREKRMKKIKVRFSVPMRLVKPIFAVLIVSVAFMQAQAKTSLQPSLDQQLGQLIMVGFQGTTLDENSSIVKAILNQQVGGVILYAKDIQTKAVLNILFCKQFSIRKLGYIK